MTKYSADEVAMLEDMVRKVRASGQIPTQAQIESKITSSGGYTREALASFGIAWPPPANWKRSLRKGVFPR